MQHLYTTPTERPARRRLGRLLGLCALALGLQLPAQAQLNYNQYTGENVAGTYTDLGSAGTAIATANTDDANSAAQNIGFSFRYNAQNFTQFVLNTNGYLRLGSAAPSTAYFFSDPDKITGGPLNSTNAADVNLLLPFNEDLTAGTSPTEYRTATTGAAPNRVCTIQWKNVSDKARGTKASQYTNFSFQVKLYETSNTIEFVYGPATSGPTAVSYKTVAVGIKGSNATPTANAEIITLTKEAEQPWAQARFFTGPVFFDILNTVVPDAGRTYRFNTRKANDAATVSVFTYGQLSPEAAPHTAQTIIYNAGTTTLTNVPVTLTVAGASTFTSTKTIASLPANRLTLVTFDPYPATTLGANTLTVSVGNDALNSNNQKTTTQTVTSNRLAYETPNQFIDDYLPLLGTNGAFAAKYTITQSTTVNSATLALISNGPSSSTYRVVLYDALGPNGGPGNELYVSPSQAVPADSRRVTVTLPNVVVNSSFYVGMRFDQDSDDFSLGAQIEDPLRPNTFYFTAPGSSLSTWEVFEDFDEFYYLRPAISVGFGAVPPCQTPVNFQFTAVTTTSANITFTASAGTGLYVAEYGPAGFAPGSGTTITSATSPITLTGLAAATTYDVYVSKSCGGTAGTSARYGPLKLTTACQPTAVTFPYTQNFDAANTLPCGYTILDANNDGYSWRLTNITDLISSSPNAIAYIYNEDDTTVGANDWFFTTALPLTAGQQYNMSFKYRVGSYDDGTVIPEGLEIRYGTAPTVAAMTAGASVYNNTNLNSTAFATVSAQAIQPATTGQYYIGFHAISNPDAYVLVIDDIAITTTALPVNQALSRAIEAYPNPTTGMLRLNLSASSARQRRATVFNTLGQVVLTRPLNTAAEQQLDLSTLSNGLYTVQLQLDNDVVVKRVSLQK
ncbi:T9SS-dependent choice-of-anchor J family protein [Hymenobacter profundi]|uniref:T9SS type A sorting domain-containing protein n=1 Tax=Hymenobacter profundi TaxID=1982110 RepID=A0ABS6X5A0_9BACT|nr:choice-of-anchor J domain-containing protein [Hymenobacter profundi]MBW3131017.1 T9SS type A sorting domain-containing protein [Hymenobacter profundi]